MYYLGLSFRINKDLQDRLPFLDTGIVDILASATNGLGVVLEHRYYGKLPQNNKLSCNLLSILGESIAVENLTTDSLRYALPFSLRSV